jgi:D-galactarolactone isomerase
MKLPDGWQDACDTHLHVYEPGYALAPTATFQPPHAPASAYREVQQRLALRRAIVVQPTGYGFDNSCTLSAIAQLGPDARGVAVVPPDAPDAELQRLHAAGIRGIRFMMLPGGVLGWDALPVLAARIAPLGWHIDLQLDGHQLPAHLPMLQLLPCRVVIDHLGKFLGGIPTEGDALDSLHRLLDSGNVWIKLSAPYESSRDGPPAYADAAVLLESLARRHPERGLWASNWPHPNIRPVPDEGELLAWAWALMGDDATRRRILVDNPAQLYGY